MFGLVEHATTYPGEPDAVYLFRTVFHGVMAAVSVGVYTVFELHDAEGFRWIAPAFPILVHFFYNTFVVITGILSIALIGSQATTIAMVYGSVAISIGITLLLLVGLRQRTIMTLHKPLKHVLSDLV